MRGDLSSFKKIPCGRSNATTLFNMEQTLFDNYIRDMLNPVVYDGVRATCPQETADYAVLED